MRLQAFVLSTFLFVVTCSEPELTLDNDFDPDNPEFDPPNTTILAIDAIHLDSDGIDVDVQDPIIKWVGNEDMEMQFRSQLDGEGWSDWSSDQQKQLEFLDEGNHRFLVQGRFMSGMIEDLPDTLDFVVDAIQGPALRMNPLKQKVALGDSVIVQIMAEEMAAVSGAGIIIKFNHPFLQLDESDVFIGEFFNGVGQVIPFTSLTVISSNVTALELDIAATGGNITAQDGVIAELRFLAISSGDEKRVWFEPTTTMRDADNIDIWTDLGMTPVLEEGLVDIE